MRGAIALILGIGLLVSSCGDSSEEGDGSPSGGGSGGSGKGGGTASAGDTGAAGDTSSAGGQGGSAGAASTVDEESFPGLYAAAFCAAQVACCEEAGGEVDAGCEADLESAAADFIDEQSGMSNRAFSLERATACLDALNAANDCDWRAIVAACASVVVGTVAAGEECTPGDCEPPEAGYVGCAELGGGSERLCRQFSATAAVGDECFDDRGGDPFAGDEAVVIICADGLYCSDGECVAGAELEGACEDSVECAQGFCFDGTCQQPALGESCEVDGAPCAIEGECVDGECVQRPLLEQVAQQETCSL